MKSKICQVLRDANQLVLNCIRVSYFQPLTHDIITHITTNSNIMYLYGGHQQVRHLKKATKRTKRKLEETNRKWHKKQRVQSKKSCPAQKFFYVLFSVTQSLFLLSFSWSPDNITASNKKSTSKKSPTSLSEITI